MPELIDKKRTEAKVFLIARFFIDRPDREVELVKAVIHRCCEEIDNQPTIEPEVRRGRWVDWSMWGESRYQCSECDCEMKYKTDFCPNCGARMDGGADNANNQIP